MIYAMTCSVLCDCGREHRWVKLGKTDKAPHERLADLQTGNPMRISYLATGKGSYDEETALHLTHRKGEADGDWVSGEWFYDTPAIRETVEGPASPRAGARRSRSGSWRAVR